MALGSATTNSHAITDRVGDLVLRRWLAQGGMAELYLATPADPARGRDVVVLKRVLPQFSGSTNFVRMFAREARLASLLQHPNIVAVHETNLDADDCFFTMEYVHGIDLGDLLEVVKSRGGAVPLAHALTIAVAMCAGLHYAHEACDASGQPLGIVHRDVSPSNVLLGFDGAIKVTDFGVAKAMAMTRLTEEGTRKGKLNYMSPEQATGETVDRRADVFAIATVLYELTTMHRLFGGDNDLAVMYNILHRERPSPREVSPSYPAALEAIVLRAVSPDIEQRYPTALAFQQDLESFAASVGLTLSADAVGAFVRSTVTMPTHPRDDPELWTATTSLRAGGGPLPTEVKPGHDATHGNSMVLPPTGPNPPVPVATGLNRPVSMMTGPNPSVPLMTGPNPSVPMTTGPNRLPLTTGPHALAPGLAPGSPAVMAPPMASVSLNQGVAPTGPWTGSQARPSTLHRWSLILALMALVVAVGVGVAVWDATRSPAEAPEPAAAPGIPPATPITPLPAVPAASSPDPAPATAAPAPAEAAVPPAEAEAGAPPPSKSRRKGKRRGKKRASAPDPGPSSPDPFASTAPSAPKSPSPASPPPAPSSTSKKPSPTDTLLPIRE